MTSPERSQPNYLNHGPQLSDLWSAVSHKRCLPQDLSKPAVWDHSSQEKRKHIAERHVCMFIHAADLAGSWPRPAGLKRLRAYTTSKYFALHPSAHP